MLLKSVNFIFRLKKGFFYAIYENFIVHSKSHIPIYQLDSQGAQKLAQHIVYWLGERIHTACMSVKGIKIPSCCHMLLI